MRVYRLLRCVIVKKNWQKDDENYVAVQFLPHKSVGWSEHYMYKPVKNGKKMKEKKKMEFSLMMTMMNNMERRILT